MKEVLIKDGISSQTWGSLATRSGGGLLEASSDGSDGSRRRIGIEGVAMSCPPV
jgi:hypothetical protein